jgi:hypothetical protein
MSNLSATAHVRCWKQHTCVGCGTIYRYVFQRSVTAQGPDNTSLQANLDKLVGATLQNEVDRHPCPTCGRYQPDMIAQRTGQHWLLLFGWLIAAVVLGILAATNVFQDATICWTISTIAGLFVVLHLLVDLQNPNRNLARNRERAESRLLPGDFELVSASSEPIDAVAEPTGFGSGRALLFALFACLTMAPLAPEAVRSVRGWPINEGWYPQVIGPDDTARIYYPHTFQTIKGYWQGFPQVQVANWQDVGLPQPNLTASSNRSDWGQSISVKSSETGSTVRPWMDVRFPPNAPADKPLQLVSKMQVRFPESAGNNQFRVRDVPLDLSATALLAQTPQAGRTYNLVFWFAFLSAAVIHLGFAWVLSRMSAGLARYAIPSQIVPIEPGATRTPPPPWTRPR